MQGTFKSGGKEAGWNASRIGVVGKGNPSK
jgi:hypothetical protein